MGKFILIGLMALSSVGAMADHSFQGIFDGKGQFHPYGEGLPLPWPFPWAEDCLVQWSKITGRYLLEDNAEKQEVELKISMVTQRGQRSIRISRFDRHGVMISDGRVPLTADQRSVDVELRPLTSEGYPVLASLKMYYDSADYSCEMSRLVPILALTELRPEKQKEVQYRLVRRPSF